MAIPLTSEFAPAPALIDRDQALIVELRERDPEPVALVREADDSGVEQGVVAAGGGRKGKRAEYYCAACGYGIVVYGQRPSCPMCGEARWEHVEWRPFSQLDDLADPAAGDPVEEAERSLLRQTVQRKLEGLPELERLIVEHRFGLQGEPKSLETVGRELGLTRERVRQLQVQALRQLETELADLAPIQTAAAGAAQARAAARVPA